MYLVFYYVLDISHFFTEDEMMSDNISASLAPDHDGLSIEISGVDRPNIIAFYTRLLDAANLYIDSLTFHLKICPPLRIPIASDPDRVRFLLEIYAKGASAGLVDMANKLKNSASLQEAQRVTEAVCPPIDWRYGSYLFGKLHLPDRPGITADVAEIIGKPRLIQGNWTDGSFIHMLAQTENSSGPMGGVPYFHLHFQAIIPEESVCCDILRDLNLRLSQDHPANHLELLTIPGKISSK